MKVICLRCCNHREIGCSTCPVIKMLFDSLVEKGIASLLRGMVLGGSSGMFQKKGSLRMQDVNTGGDLGAEVVTEGGFPSHAFFQGHCCCQKLQEFGFYSPRKQLALDYAFEYVPNYSLLPASGFDSLLRCASAVINRGICAVIDFESPAIKEQGVVWSKESSEP